MSSHLLQPIKWPKMAELDRKPVGLELLQIFNTALHSTVLYCNVLLVLGVMLCIGSTQAPVSVCKQEPIAKVLQITFQDYTHKLFFLFKYILFPLCRLYYHTALTGGKYLNRQFLPHRRWEGQEGRDIDNYCESSG